MKKIILYLFTAVLLSSFSACMDILDTAPYNQLASANMWQTESSCDQGVMGIYYSLRFPVYNGSITGESVNLGYYGWEVFGSTGQSRLGVGSVFASSVLPSNGQFSFVWKWCYDGVHRANDAITNLPNAPLTDDKKERLIAESKILRAFFYMRLNELFGNGGIGVPIYLTTIAQEE
ncbi:MAG: RagB/SusD family nutrient uptake outer membrane protein, partial [Dysgonamonadaceae bacterium]|nr:RagB/SusD family nutrient uptake outer membrane protein [Dysgonamonadaceae bacterium]